MKNLKWFAIGCLGLWTTTARAADESVLNLIPRDAAGFIHVHVGDLWKHDSFQPVRDFLTKTEPRILRLLEKEVGFPLTSVDTVTLIFPEIGDGPAPLFLVRMNKPFDKAKMLSAMRAETPGQRGYIRSSPYGDSQMTPPKIMYSKKDIYPTEKSIPKLDEKKTRPLNEPKLAPPPLPPKGFPPKARLEDVAFFAPKEVSEEPEDHSESASSPRMKPNLNARHYILRDQKMHLFIVDDRTILLADDRNGRDGMNSLTVLCMQLLRRSENGPLDLALAEAAKKKAVVAGINMGEVAKSVLGQLLLTGDRPPALLSAKSAVLSLDVAEEMTVVLTVEAADAEGAKKIEENLKALVGMAKDSLPKLEKQAKNSATSELLGILLEQGDKALAKLTIEQKGNLVLATTSMKGDAAFQAALKAALAQVKGAAAKTQSQNNLKQFGIAAHGYHDANGQFPFPGVTAPKGQPLGGAPNANPNLSWRVAILPYIEQGPLYNQFKFDEPWDSEHNKTLIEKMPRIFAPVNGVKAEKGHTFYQIFVGREALHSGMRLPASFNDGTSNTLMIVESGDSVPWTRPEDMLYDSKKRLPKLGGLFDGDFNVLFADGSVRFIRKSIAEKTLRALITPAGGEVIDFGELDK